MDKLDAMKISQDKDVLKDLQKNEKIILSSKLTKINHVNKKQDRIILLTDKNLYNILPSSTFLSLFTRVKRKISYGAIVGMTVSRFGHQFVIHVGKQHDYRFSSPNMKLKIVENLVDCWCKFHKKKMRLHYYDDLTLQMYTTTIIDLQKNKRKEHTAQPLFLDAETMKQSQQAKAESKLIFKNQNNKNIESFEEFQLLKVLGRGAFGKVMLCQKKGTEQYYAVKSMRKQNLIEKQHLEKTKTERFLLEKANHPFLVSLQYAFQTKQKVFFVMNFIRGGQMFTHLRKAKRFSQPRAKFYAGQVFLAINYLHNMGYLYRDLKPQNILFDIDGYIKVSDYGLAKYLKPGQKTYSLAGTPDYVSPQIIVSKGQTFSTDWWAFGILLYEMVYGSPPFYNRDHEKMFHDILNRPLFFDNSKVQGSQDVKNLISSLLQKSPQKRLGSKDQNDIKNHPWFYDLDWDKLLKKQIVPEFVPAVHSAFDVQNFDQQFTNQQPINSLVNTDMLLLSKFQKQFEGIDFNKSDSKKEQPSFAKKK